MKCFVIPVITGVTGIVTKGLKQYLETIPGKHSIDSPQKIAVLGTSHIMTIRNLKPEWWGSPLVQEEKYQEKPVKREKEIIIIIIIIIIVLVVEAALRPRKNRGLPHKKVQIMSSLNFLDSTS
jgi:hypothetical protein